MSHAISQHEEYWGRKPQAVQDDARLAVKNFASIYGIEAARTLVLTYGGRTVTEITDLAMLAALTVAAKAATARADMLPTKMMVEVLYLRKPVITP